MSQANCSFPDCGCAESRLCMYPPPNIEASCWIPSFTDDDKTERQREIDKHRTSNRLHLND